MEWLRHFRPFRRLTALTLICMLLHSQGIVVFQTLNAETAGATAPEVTKFEPVDTTDLVNLASGDFNYTIPVINIPGPEGGYPLALSYHSGIQHGEEASWVGLGWNLQPGSIARGVRGYPDDFYGVGITTNYLSNVYETYSLNVSCWVEVGVSYTTYKGFSGSVGLTVSTGIKDVAQAGGSVGLTVSASGEVGAYAAAFASVNLAGNSVGISVNTDFHSVSGAVSVRGSSGIGISVNNSGDIGVSYSGRSGSPERTVGGLSIGSSGATSATFSSYSGGGQHQDSMGVGGSVFGIGFNVGYTRSWIDKNETEIAFGYYHHRAPDPPFEEGKTRVNEWIMESDPNAIPGDSKEHALAIGLHYLPSNDGYAVMGQGTGGGLKLTRREDRVYKPRRLIDEWTEASTPPWEGVPDENTKPRFVFDGDNTETFSHPELIGLTSDQLATYVKDPTGSVASQITQTDISSSAPDIFVGKVFQPGARVVRERLGGIDNTQFVGFDVWEIDGKRYIYNDPVWNWSSTSISANKPVIGTGEWFRSKSIIYRPHAYAWYLSELKYPDYLDNDSIDGLSEGDSGGWVKFGYITGSNYYNWHSTSDGQLSDGPINRIDKLGKEKAGMMYSLQSGVKQLKYLNSVETATHRAIFSTSPRADGKEIRWASSPAPVVGINVTKAQGSEDVYVIRLNNDPALIGIEIKPEEWVVIPGESTEVPITDGACQGYVSTETSFSANIADSRKAFAINGVPLVVTSLKKVSTVSYREVIPSPDAQAECREIRSQVYYITIKLSDQFWNNPIPGVTNQALYPEIWARWQSIQNGSTVIGTPGMLKLDRIYLIEKSTNKLVKQVNFKYSYRLSPGTPNSGADSTTPENMAFGVQNAKGKLTLESLQFFGQGGEADGEFKLPPYRFEYANNPVYGSKYSHDRWGFHKSDGGPWRHREANASDQSAWCLSKIILPTGGKLQIQYEAKDYARVQDRVPLNPQANQAAIAHFLVDLKPWVSDIQWPTSKAEWEAFRAKVATTPFHLFPLEGATVGGTIIPRASSALNFTTIPIQTAPNPIDLKLWLKLRSAAYQSKLTVADSIIGVPAQKTSGVIGDAGTSISIPDGAAPLTPQQALAVPGTESVTVDRMVNLVFEYWTAGTRTYKRLQRPLKALDPNDLAAEGDSDRGDMLTRSVLVRMKRAADNGVDFFVTDPDFDWPKEPPSSMYLTWTANPATPKIGGGVRVKRVVSFDGRRSFTTGYSYTDLVDGVWTTSGVAAQEPPPFGYSSDDDRVIQTEKGGWANEVGGGIYHSRVVVRHSWTEDSVPAGIRRSGADGLPMGDPVQTPMGESVFRFITPADLPHRQKAVEYVKTVWKDGNGALHQVTPASPLPADASLIFGLYTNSAHLTEIMNIGSWWGKLLWKEDRDKVGRPLNRVENDYTQLEGYLRLFPANEMGHTTGFDPDVEKAWGAPRNTDMSYTWAPRDTSVPNMPRLVRKEDPGGTVGVTLPTGESGYLNASVNVTVMNASTSQRASVRFKPSVAWKTEGTPEYDDPILADPEPPGWHSTITAVREMNIPPVVSEVRTYGEGLKLLGVTRNTKWDARTGLVMEAQSRARKTSGEYEWLVERTWPAYWMYGGLDTAPLPGADWTSLDSNNYSGRNSIKNMLSQTSQATTSRILGTGSEVFLNSKVDTWWQPEGTTNSLGRWMKGGQFVWNGNGSNLQPTKFAGFQTAWEPTKIESVGLQPYKASPDNWIFVGATTLYDAYAHAIEVVDGDGVWGCSKYGYPYTNDGLANLPNAALGVLLPAGTMPVAKFTNARNAETKYWNFEGPTSGDPTMPLDALTAAVIDGNPLQRLATAYSGEHAYNIGSKDLVVTLPTSGPDELELRCFVKAPSASAARATYPSASEVISVTQSEGGWWFLRAKAKRSSGVNRVIRGVGCLVDDVAVFPWRNNGAPVSVSHYAYDRAFGLVSSITGSNGRTTRYEYDKLGRLMKVYDVYGKPTAATRYGYAVAP